jgi:hypothetical protein
VASPGSRARFEAGIGQRTIHPGAGTVAGPPALDVPLFNHLRARACSSVKASSSEGTGVGVRFDCEPSSHCYFTDRSFVEGRVCKDGWTVVGRTPNDGNQKSSEMHTMSPPPRKWYARHRKGPMQSVRRQNIIDAPQRGPAMEGQWT